MYSPKLYRCFILFTLIPFTAFTQMKLEAEIRPRAELRNGYKTLPSDSSSPARIVSQRTRLKLDYKNTNYNMRITFQDVRLWGDEELYSATGVVGDKSSVDLHEAWFQYHFSDNISVRVGRQEWDYDDSRLLSRKNWNQHGMSYDAVLMKYENNNFQMDIGGSWNSDRADLLNDSFTTDKMKTVNFLYLRNEFNKSFEATFLNILTGYKTEINSTDIVYFTTFGPMIHGSVGNFFYEGSFYYQTGTYQTNEKISAYLAHSDIGYKITSKLTSLVGFDYLTGNDNNKSELNAFYQLSGSRHKYYGHMDQFSNTLKATNKAGLQDYYLKASYSFNKTSRIFLHYHTFRTARDLPGMGKYLGDEFDIMWMHQFDFPIKIRAGLAFLLPGNTLKSLRGIELNEANFAYFGYLQVSFAPVLFTGG